MYSSIHSVCISFGVIKFNYFTGIPIMICSIVKFINSLNRVINIKYCVYLGLEVNRINTCFNEKRTAADGKEIV